MNAPVSFAKDRVKILLLEGIHQSAAQAFHDAGYHNVELLPTALNEDDLIKKIQGVHFIGIRSRTQLTAKVLNAADRLIAAGCFCIGTNQVDLDAAKRNAVVVFNAPYSNTRSVAELVLAEAIILLRGIPEKNAVAHRGGWLKSAKNSFEIRGKTLGIIGYGSIGSQLSVLAESLGMRVIFHDMVSKLPLGNASQVPLDSLLAKSDVVSLHVPELDSTKNMIGAAEIAKMKATSVLINASRGTVVDIDALADALREKRMLGTAVDVFPIEPKGNDDEFISPLRAFDNALLTPHVGGSTMEAQVNIGIEVAEKLIRYSDNGSTLTSVNFPEVALPPHPNHHRLLHVHENVPGVLSAINSVFAEAGINIGSQFLQTDDAIGYVVIDVDASNSEEAMDRLQSIDHTIRVRRLF
ncbi:phosphoglycerate dehydrogenase [Litorivicinus lipolyticus]|uniref:D-3-phosphoglycerate dehydrogenase n=1 Tax=Litorivicinus lipolyticus TaxID=418701 RepID=A0A5Q2Q8V5_9GAMM|nr:phosphoglycerate dehydrogenase [Litorivicinus lipolyticus]QGG79294.1 phosphoglycerate dehydrogenase [Litorivicinus lipolyticus]